MDLRKWIAQDGINNAEEFLVTVGENADETTTSIVTETTASPDRSTAPSPITPEAPALHSKTTEVQTQPNASTPMPQVAENAECMTSILDEIRQLTISVGDLRDELDAANSKILLRELEHKDLKVKVVYFMYGIKIFLRNSLNPRDWIVLMTSQWQPLYNLKQKKSINALK